MADFQFLWWHWAILGGVLLVADVLLINVYYLIWFGIGAIAVALSLLIFPDLPPAAQITVFGALSAAFLLVWLFFLRPQRSARLLRQAQDELPGNTGIVVRFNEGRGVMRLQKPIGGRDLWDFTASASLRPGEVVTVAALNDDGIAITKEEN